MNIDSKRVQEIAEEYIGEGRSRYIFGRHHRALYEVLSESVDLKNLTEDIFKRGLARCEFKDPEKVGLISFLCPILCFDILDRVMGKTFKEIYKFTLYFWYALLWINLLQSLIEWKMMSSIPLMIICMIVTSWSFRNWSRDWNTQELIYNIVKVLEKG